MKRHLTKLAIVPLVIFACAQNTRSQGTFQNLSFENPILPLGGPGIYPITNLFPGWTGYIGGSQTATAFFDDISLGAAAISLQGPGSSLPILQGNYSVFLQPSYPNHLVDAAIGQTGQLPTNAETLLFYANSTIQVTFSGQNIPLTQIGSGPNYGLFGGDISAFAGQIGELRFTTLGGGTPMLDNILFSATPIPEPSTIGMFGLGTLLLGGRLWRKQRPW